MKSPRNMRLVRFLALLLVFLVSCFGTTVINLNHGPWGDSGDVPLDVFSSQGLIFTVGGIYDRFGVARIDGATGALAPGSSNQPWGLGIEDPPSPPPGPMGWVAFKPSITSSHTALGGTLSGNALYLTGATSAANAAGYGVVSLADGSVVTKSAFQLPDGIYGSIGQQPGEDIFVIGDHVYIFGAGARGLGVEDVLWVAERTLAGANTMAFGDECPEWSTCYPARTGFSVLPFAEDVTYGGTALASGNLAYTVARIGDTASDGSIGVTTIGLPTGLLDALFEDGEVGVYYQPKAIALRQTASGVTRIVIGGVEGAPGDTDTNGFVIQYLVDGTRDPDFGVDGKITFDPTTGKDEINDIGIRGDGKLIAVGRMGFGTANGQRAFSARFLVDGSFDTSYAPTGYQTVNIEGSAYNAVEVAGRVRAVGAVPGQSGSRPNMLVSDLVDQP